MQRSFPSAADRRLGTGPIRTAVLCAGLVGVAVLGGGGTPKGMGWPQQIDFRLDGALLARLTDGEARAHRPAPASYDEAR